MTTITIRNGGEITKKVFENIAELQDYLSLLISNKEFSDSFKKELDKREEDLKSGKESGISWKEVKSKITDLK